MKRYISYSVILAVVLTSALVFFNRCSMGDTTRVTIYLNPSIQAHKIKHNLLNILADWFVTKAYAVTVPDWVFGYGSLSLSITGPGMDPIEASIPPSAEKYTIEVPSGAEREFIIIATQSGSRKLGGIKTDFLEPGEEKDITMYMVPIPTGLTIEVVSSLIMVHWSYVPNVTGYYIYRSVNSESGPYTRIGGLVPPGTSGDYGVNIQDVGLVAGNRYYYKITVLSSYGEGVPTVSASVLIQ